MIVFDQVGKLYPGGFEALKNISFEIAKGELFLVAGHSGAGKSTLLKLIAAIERPTSGTVLIGKQNVAQLSHAAIPHMRRKFGLVFQDHKLLYDRNVFENVALPLYINGIVGQEAARRIRAALDKVGLLSKEKSMPISMSGGEQQRLAIARAVVSRPSVLIADEPTGNLDETYADEIMKLFLAFHQVGVTVIIATHNTSAIAAGAAKILRLDHGGVSA
ncbi:cell division ATP-binding protein FtsE [mine drainage metagenome]|uniref:Cell division ATP-binding protein FtsE n=1 Tax=mine drainage metagenome TaxID=410659 RepID=A0A1J5PPJ8_9ZZZZ